MKKLQHKSDKIPKFTQAQLERTAVQSALNMGAPLDMWVPDYGQVLARGQLTESGRRFFKAIGKLK